MGERWWICYLVFHSIFHLVIFVQWAKLQITDRKPLPLSSLTVWNVCFLLSLANFTLRIFVCGFMWFADELFQFAHHVFTLVGSLSAYIAYSSPASIIFHFRIANCTNKWLHIVVNTANACSRRKIWCPEASKWLSWILNKIYVRFSKRCAVQRDGRMKIHLPNAAAFAHTNRAIKVLKSTAFQ